MGSTIIKGSDRTGFNKIVCGRCGKPIFIESLENPNFEFCGPCLKANKFDESVDVALILRKEYKTIVNSFNDTEKAIFKALLEKERRKETKEGSK